MSQFAILRIQKLKAGVAVRRSLKHAFREQETPNADPDRLSDNTHLGAANVDLTHMARGSQAVSTINKLHETLIRNRLP